jgi:hypothetical protein
VLLDQTHKQCVREHGCTGQCPLQAFFTGIEMREGRVSDSPSRDDQAR